MQLFGTKADTLQTKQCDYVTLPDEGTLWVTKNCIYSVTPVMCFFADGLNRFHISLEWCQLQPPLHSLKEGA